MQTHKLQIVITDENAEVLEIFHVYTKSETLNTAASKVRSHVEDKFDTEEP